MTIELTREEMMALADGAQLILVTRAQYQHVPAIAKNFPCLESARAKLVHAVFSPEQDQPTEAGQ